MRTVARVLGLVAGLVVVAACGTAMVVLHEVDRAMRTPLEMPAPVLFRIAPGSSLARVALDLERDGWLVDHRLLEVHAYLAGIDSTIRAGTYEIVPGDTLTAALGRFVRGQTKTYNVTFIEGSRFADMRRILASQRHLEHTIGKLSDEAVMAAIGAPAVPPEGMFFPATYRYNADSTDVALLRRAYRRMQRILDRLWADRDGELPYASPYDALIMASIIEKETARRTERARIAGVFVRRLSKGMKLQTDPTVIYGLGDGFDGNLRRSDLRRDTAYNTYTRHGLPPTPIAMPGKASIEAALHPASGTALYFVARGDGTHQFSDTLPEHNRAVHIYQARK